MIVRSAPVATSKTRSKPSSRSADTSCPGWTAEGEGAGCTPVAWARASPMATRTAGAVAAKTTSDSSSRSASAAWTWSTAGGGGASAGAAAAAVMGPQSRLEGCEGLFLLLLLLLLLQRRTPGSGASRGLAGRAAAAATEGVERRRRGGARRARRDIDGDDAFTFWPSWCPLTSVFVAKPCAFRESMSRCSVTSAVRGSKIDSRWRARARNNSGLLFLFLKLLSAPENWKTVIDDALFSLSFYFFSLFERWPPARAWRWRWRPERGDRHRRHLL